MLTITTSRGTTIKAKYMAAINGGTQVMAEIVTDKPLADVAEALDGCTSFRAADEAHGDGVYTMFEGYTRIAFMQRTKEDAIRVTLSKERKEG